GGGWSGGGGARWGEGAGTGGARTSCSQTGPSGSSTRTLTWIRTSCSAAATMAMRSPSPEKSDSRPARGAGLESVFRAKSPYKTFGDSERVHHDDPARPEACPRPAAARLVWLWG